jgi:hypothetical protein
VQVSKKSPLALQAGWAIRLASVLYSMAAV